MTRNSSCTSKQITIFIKNITAVREKCVLAMKHLIYIVPTGLNGLGGCFLFYQYFAPNGAVPLGTKYW